MEAQIKFNGGIFQITSYNSNGDIEKIQRSVEPKIEVEVTQLDNNLKIKGWKNYQPFIYCNGRN